MYLLCKPTAWQRRLHVCLEKVLDAIAAATDSDFNRLWPLGVPEEVRLQCNSRSFMATFQECRAESMFCPQEFIGMMPKTAFSVIDSPSVMKNKAARASAVQVCPQNLIMLLHCIVLHGPHFTDVCACADRSLPPPSPASLCWSRRSRFRSCTPFPHWNTLEVWWETCLEICPLRLGTHNC